MNGDLGNLLTGEMGEAEARFSYEDFGADFGPRIVGRVRRRRAVRAAGVGGGTMLTAGALAVGATHMPWGVLGATPGMGGRDCVTTPPSADPHVVTVIFGGSEQPSAQMNVTDPVTGGVRLTGVEQADGTWVFTDAAGNPSEVTLDGDGRYMVQASDASWTVVLSMPSASASPTDPTATGSVTYTYTDGAQVGTAVPSASDDCYTPSPTPSHVPSTALDPVLITDTNGYLKPDDVTSPFQCGFVMDSLGHGSSQVSITDTTWVSPAAYNATVKERLGTSVGVPLELGSAPIPTVRIRVDLAATTPWASVFGVGEPTDAMATSEDGTPMVDSGASFVMVRDGVVVGTMDTTTQGAGQHFSFWHDGATDTQELTLVNAADAFVACPGQTLQAEGDTTYAVAGSYVKDPTGTDGTGVEYSWTALEAN